jgi:hypothetical protein
MAEVITVAIDLMGGMAVSPIAHGKLRRFQ